MKRISINFSKSIFHGFWFNLFYAAKWYTRGECIGYVNEKQIQTLQEVHFAFSFLRITYRFKNRYVFF